MILPRAFRAAHGPFHFRNVRATSDCPDKGHLSVSTRAGDSSQHVARCLRGIAAPGLNEPLLNNTGYGCAWRFLGLVLPTTRSFLRILLTAVPRTSMSGTEVGSRRVVCRRHLQQCCLGWWRGIPDTVGAKRQATQDTEACAEAG